MISKDDAQQNFANAAKVILNDLLFYKGRKERDMISKDVAQQNFANAAKVFSMLCSFIKEKGREK